MKYLIPILIILMTACGEEPKEQPTEPDCSNSPIVGTWRSPSDAIRIAENCYGFSISCDSIFRVYPENGKINILKTESEIEGCLSLGEHSCEFKTEKKDGIEYLDVSCGGQEISYERIE